MTSTQTQEMLAEAGKFSTELISNARSDVAVKLQAVDDSCRSLIESGGTVSIASVRGWLATNRGITIAPSTLMNLRTNTQTGEKSYSPLRLIINKYVGVQKMSAKRATKIVPSFGSFVLSEAEMREIEDHQVRYKVQLLIGRVRNLETQLNHVRAIGNLPMLPTAGEMKSSSLEGSELITLPKGDRDSKLDEEEQKSLEDFLSERSMLRRKIAFDENGALTATHLASPKRSTTFISKPFLKSALSKVLRSHE